MVGERSEEGFPALTLESGALGGVEAIFVPEAGMICCSLRHRGRELLGQRGGLGKYVDSGSTMGIPFLHPWANRLERSRFDRELAERPERDRVAHPVLDDRRLRPVLLEWIGDTDRE